MEKSWLNSYEPGVPATIDSPEYPLNYFLEQAAEKAGDHIALNYRGGVIRYGHLNELADNFAASMAQLGVEPGDRVAIQLPTCPQFIIAYYAALKLGATVVPLNPAYVKREVYFFLKNSGAKLLITLLDNLSSLNRSASQTGLQAVVITDLESYGSPLNRLVKRFRKKSPIHPPWGTRPILFRMEEMTANRGRPPATKPGPEDPAVIMYTGGINGTPLGAVLTHANLAANVLQCTAWNTLLKERPGPILLALPLSHSYGMTVGMNVGIANAREMVLLPRFHARTVLQSIARFRIYFLPGVPAMFEALLKEPAAYRLNLRSLGAALSGGAPLPVAVQQEFERITGGYLIEGYGLSEASPVTHANPYRGIRKVGSIGVPLPSTLAKIVDLQNPERELPPGSVGELCIKGPQVMKCYFNAPAETEQVLKNGWFHTGDIVQVDEDGFAYIVDRKKDLVISGGYNVYPAEIRAVLLTHPAIEQVKVSAQRDPYRGESLKAEIIPVSGSNLTEEEVLRFCRENLAAYKIPRYLEING